jgi:hypothetical protein
MPTTREAFDKYADRFLCFFSACVQGDANTPTRAAPARPPKRLARALECVHVCACVRMCVRGWRAIPGGDKLSSTKISSKKILPHTQYYLYARYVCRLVFVCFSVWVCEVSPSPRLGISAATAQSLCAGTRARSPA